MVKDTENKKTRPHRSYAILALFATTAVVGAMTGSFIDGNYGTKPFGTLISMVLSYAISWGITLRWIIKPKEVRDVGSTLMKEAQKNKIDKNKKNKKNKKHKN